jgi:hypothetical protein
MSVISVRALNSNHEPTYGNGQGDFLYDLDAVAQIIQTRLLLFQGEWWQNLQDGLPLFQSILGVGGAGRKPEAISLLIQQNILGLTPYVTGISDIVTTYQPNLRNFKFSCNVQTQFGTIQVTFTPGLSAVIPSPN